MTSAGGQHRNRRVAEQGFGELLRAWRERRRLSQLELASQSGVSTRHLSFVETGRSTPSREMVLHLAEQLTMPLRDRNQLLLAAGYAPIYPERSMDAPELAAARDAIRMVVQGHEPYPAFVVDRCWNMIDGNASVSLFTSGCADEVLEPPVNTFRIALHPKGLAPRIINLGETRTRLLNRLRRQIALTGDTDLSDLYAELRGYPCDQDEPVTDLSYGAADIATPLRIRSGADELSFITTIATFGTPRDVTVSELAIESFFPADPITAAALHSRWAIGSAG